MKKFAIIATWRMAYDGVNQAMKLLENNASSDVALIEAIESVENNPLFHSVGLSGYPNRHGVIQLDGAYMNGTTLSLGAVAAMENIASPIRVARILSEYSYNNFLVGVGAQEFALKNGFKKVDLMTKETQLAYQKRLLADEKKLTSYKGHDTVGVCCLDQSGLITAGTSTSGLFMKENNRVGDSPVCGSGFYADSEIGAATATGVGEEIMKGCLSYEVVRQMKQGITPQVAASELVAQFSADLIRRRGHAEPISLICMNREGEFGVGTNIKFAFVTADDQQGCQVWIAQPTESGCQVRPISQDDMDVD